ncbi:MAG: DNA polymerase III subunit delta' [Proteobacteria bacterium]|nr:DNA polymerase III subunit delta' [Pseudomonadota bacterium]
MSLEILSGPVSDVPEVDRLANAPHPREMLSLIGHEAAEREFLDAYRAGRLHHAWLIGGPEGIGKATLAYRIARFLLAHPDPGHPDVQRASSLHVSERHPVSHQIAASAHPDLSVIRRAYDPQRKSVPTEISADFARKGLDVFNKTAAGGGYRIAIVDACDDLNSHSANALLKTLEEPPQRGLFLLVAHQPRRVMATIRSRCRTLPVRELASDEVLTITRALPALVDTARDLHDRAAALSDGSVRQALAMLDPKRLAFNDRLVALLAEMDRAERGAFDLVAEATAGRDGEAAFEQFCTLLQRWLHQRLHREGGPGAGAFEVAELWSDFEGQRREVDIYNLDRRPLVVATLRRCAEIAKLR